MLVVAGDLTVFAVPTPPSSGRPQPASLRFRVREAQVPCSSTRCPGRPPHAPPHPRGARVRRARSLLVACNPPPPPPPRSNFHVAQSVPNGRHTTAKQQRTWSWHTTVRLGPSSPRTVRRTASPASAETAAGAIPTISGGCSSSVR